MSRTKWYQRGREAAIEAIRTATIESATSGTMGAFWELADVNDAVAWADKTGHHINRAEGAFEDGFLSVIREAEIRFGRFARRLAATTAKKARAR